MGSLPKEILRCLAS